MDRFAARVPQIVLAAEKLLWEESEPEAGVGILKYVATPAAHALLRRFGLGKAGDEDLRMQALYALLEAGQISQRETLRLWSEGEWREIQLRQYEISDRPTSEYTPKVVSLLSRGQQALERDDLLKAEELFHRVLDLEPHAKEAFNNLGAIYARRGEHTKAKEVFQSAVNIDPQYVLPRCNLATYLLEDSDVDGADAMLSPLADVSRFHPHEMASYSYAQARVAIHRDDYDAARSSLQMALEIWPDHEPAEELLGRLELLTAFRQRTGSFFDRQLKRDRAKRKRLQAKLTTSEPTLAEALPLYSKEVLTGMARIILPYGGWSALRKAELLGKVVEELKNTVTVARLVDQLNDVEQAALHQVLARGGHMPWQEFDGQYGNDLEESQYWQYHEPETTMGRLRRHGLLMEATVSGKLLVAIPLEVRRALRDGLD
jgi:Tfp pilus assembly protein PilF